MSAWIVELVTNDSICNQIEIDAANIRKISYFQIIIDGQKWELPPRMGLSFAEIVRLPPQPKGK